MLIWSTACGGIRHLERRALPFRKRIFQFAAPCTEDSNDDSCSSRITLFAVDRFAFCSVISGTGTIGPKPSAVQGRSCADRFRDSAYHSDDYGSLGYGEGYVAAEDHVCNIADAIITARGEQAMYFGPGANNRNVVADIVMRAMGIPEGADEEFEGLPPVTQEWLVGYAAGYNTYLREAEITSCSEDCTGALCTCR